MEKREMSKSEAIVLSIICRKEDGISTREIMKKLCWRWEKERAMQTVTT